MWKKRQSSYFPTRERQDPMIEVKARSLEIRNYHSVQTISRSERRKIPSAVTIITVSSHLQLQSVSGANPQQKALS